MSNKLLTPSSVESLTISVAARTSPLSRAQVQEVLSELITYFPECSFKPVWLETTGDQDLKTSLRCLDKTDFFTKEIDCQILKGQCRIGIHSAKDLPHTLPRGLTLVAVTKGLDSSDSLVFREGETLETLPTRAKIATSSIRREEMVRSLRSDLTFLDLRGTIGARLAKLQAGAADGVVVAECALIRLNLTHLNRMRLSGETSLGQGQLAVVAKESDEEMKVLFSLIDSRPKILYLGLNLPEANIQASYLHYPIIKIEPRAFTSPDIQEAFSKLPLATHLIFTSQTSVELFFAILDDRAISRSVLFDKICIAVGEKTAEAIRRFGVSVQMIPKEETAEGIIREIELKNLSKSHFFWPHSALSRPLITKYLMASGHIINEVILYDTYPRKLQPHPEGHLFDQILFTSPSTVDAYLGLFGSFPKGKILNAIGPITHKYLTKRRFL